MSPRHRRLPQPTQRPTSSPLTYRDSLPPPLPSPAAPPTASEIAALDAAVSDASVAELKPGDGAYLGADWATRGDWVGRYGTRMAVLCAAGAPFNHEIINDWTYKYSYDLGPDRRPVEGVRHWIQWLHTDDPRVLWDPLVDTRREADWDDHGETYAKELEGPDLWIAVTVPAGVSRLSAYFVNKDGHVGFNRWRDYLVELRPWRADVRDSYQLKPFGVAKVREFWGGVYENFAVAGPGRFYLHISRNNSGCCSILSAVMTDKLTGPPTAHEGVQCKMSSSAEYAAYQAPPNVATTDPKRPDALDSLRTFWSDSYEAMDKRRLVPQTTADRILAYRTLAALRANADDKTPFDKLMAWWRRKLPLVTVDDRTMFIPEMQVIYKAETIAYPQITHIH